MNSARQGYICCGAVEHSAVVVAVLPGVIVKLLHRLDFVVSHSWSTDGDNSVIGLRYWKLAALSLWNYPQKEHSLFIFSFDNCVSDGFDDTSSF